MPRWGDFSTLSGYHYRAAEIAPRKNLLRPHAPATFQFLRKKGLLSHGATCVAVVTMRATHLLRCVVPPRSRNMLKPFESPHPNPSGQWTCRVGGGFVFRVPPSCVSAMGLTPP